MKMLVFIKKIFYIGSLLLSSLVSTTSLNCISMKNQECKVRPEIINVNNNEPVKGICNIEYIWNPSNCKCECDKSCNFGGYLDYENCKYRKNLVDKLIEEYNENVEETSLIIFNSTKCKTNSCILYIVLFSIFFTINIGIATYFVYYKYINHNQENVSAYDYVYQRKN